LIACLFTNTFGNNLILNPGFESTGNVPQNWIITGPVPGMQPIVSIDKLNKYEGTSSLKMESNNENVHGRVFQIISIHGGLTYLFNAKFKTKDVNSIDKSVMIRIKWLNGNENIGYHYVYEIEKESKGWSMVSQKIKALPAATSAEISLEFRWGTGTVWWDDISMASCEPIPPRTVKVATFIAGHLDLLLKPILLL
jgi:hypothetical protein